ncbi:MAG: TIGR03905 family TSCPD domain-containing protein [Clostridia bacterium]|nr:TIGR03905 family TSCPD domain-containing protein [Clostridia bacterium]
MESYKTTGVCSRTIEFEVDGNILKSVKFIGGCAGNTQGVSKLATNRPIDEVISLLEGIKCRNNTSCPDQLAKALKNYKETH